MLVALMKRTNMTWTNCCIENTFHQEPKKWSIFIKLNIVPDTTKEQLGAQHNQHKSQEWIFYTHQSTRKILYEVMNERDLNASLKNA